MAGTAVRRRLTWQAATVVTAAWETPSVRTISLDVPGWAGHMAGQHLDVRLTADDGYVAEREYSIGSAPGEPVAITVERLADGEVSPYLTDELRPGDQVEIRGPVGGYFVWEPADDPPLLLLAGGSGIVPLRSILRSRDQSGSAVPARLLYSARSLPDVIYRAELDKYGVSPQVAVSYALTRQQPPGWTGYAGRVGETVLAEVAWPAGDQAIVFVCGPTAFVEAVAAIMVKLGYPPERVKTERFGGTGTQ
jgi:ferredoxin-NADP reductase